MSYSIVTFGYKSLNNIQRRITEAKNASLKPDEFIVIINPYGDLVETNKIIKYVTQENFITRYVIASQNMGCATSFNLGMSISNSEYVVVLNDDCTTYLDTYEKIIQGFNYPDIGVVGIIQGSSPGYIQVPDNITIAQGFLLAFRKEMITQIGGYHEIASPLACETELCIRAYVNGWRTNIVEAPFHHVHDISNNPGSIINHLGIEKIPLEFQKITEPLLRQEVLNLLKKND